ncbi:hypothetical protein [Capnocytophaga endodontalis]|jgi:hypothetical protein|uniref:Uncharacterized protein n=1 Tax=Capnocytophaga endodontalis TaxID=2708117 RepID=A0A1Z4BR20_9FLAO|nr:hypothetical protein [Capnocytophaga endodontalis]ASF43755.1 hypothetical protein CBG49_12080 [Capnocytophaga endodontalis]
MKQEIPTEALNEIFYNAMQRARRENRALGLSNITVIDGELVEEKPDGTIILLGKKALFGKMIPVKKGIYKLKKAI